MASIKLLLNKQRMLNDGRFPLVFQIIHQRRKLLYYTKYRVFQQQFNNELREIEYCESSAYSLKEIAEINRELRREYKKLKNRVLELEKANEPYSVEDIVESNKKDSHHSYNLLQYIDNQIAYKKAMGKDGIAAAYHSTRISLKKYLNTISARKTDIGMEKIDCSFVTGYEDCLYAQGWLEIQSTIICAISGRSIIQLSGMDANLKMSILLFISIPSPARQSSVPLIRMT